MNNKADIPDELKDVEYVKVEGGAPDTCRAEFFNHPEKGWVRVLNGVTDIEASIVVIAYGDPITGEFIDQYITRYPNTEEHIATRDSEHVIDKIRDDFSNPTPADELVETITNEKQPE